MNFEQLALSRPLLKAVAEEGYTTPTPIQQKAIPPVLEERDLLGCAQTGTGKTAAFALPMLQLLSANRPSHRKVRALVLTPTRELALQIGESFTAYGKYLTVTNTVIFGGVGQAPQVAALKKGADVLVACPGRLLDLMDQGFVDLSQLEIFVLDEADRMLDMGFIHDVKKVIARLPARRQNLMFSATMPPQIEQLAQSFLHAPTFVKVDPVSSTVDKIDQKLYFVSKADKRRLLAWLLKDPAITSALVFSRTKHGADRIARDLTKAGIPAAAIHGNKSQNARVAALEGFKSGKMRVLVATDIAARGIDISELSHVFNFDLPEVPETYVHRIGRTARAGQSGCAISFCCPEEKEYLQGIEKLNRKKIPVVAEHPWAEGADTPAPPPQERPARGSRKAAAEPAATRRAAPSAESSTDRPIQTGKEELSVEETNKKEAGETLSASAKRRRRRHRSSAAKEAAAQNAQNGQTAQSAQNTQAGQEAHHAQHPARGQGQNSQQPRTAKNGSAKPARQQQTAKAARPAKGAAQEAAPAHERRSSRSSARGQNQQPQHQKNPRPAKPVDDDPGLLLISRRPPVQKYASFEDYMKDHEGSAAVDEGTEE